MTNKEYISTRIERLKLRKRSMKEFDRDLVDLLEAMAKRIEELEGGTK